jgi:hypothetical protein
VLTLWSLQVAIANTLHHSHCNKLVCSHNTSPLPTCCITIGCCNSIAIRHCNSASCHSHW